MWCGWDGSLHGAAARLALLPDAEVGVVVLSNLANNDATSVTGRRVLEALVPTPDAAGYQPSAVELDRVAGLYRPLDVVDPEFWYLGFMVAVALASLLVWAAWRLVQRLRRPHGA